MYLILSQQTKVSKFMGKNALKHTAYQWRGRYFMETTIKFNAEFFTKVIAEKRNISISSVTSSDITAFRAEFNMLCNEAFTAIQSYAITLFHGKQNTKGGKATAQNAINSLKKCFNKVNKLALFESEANALDVFTAHLYGFKAVKSANNDTKALCFCSNYSADSTKNATAVKSAIAKFITVTQEKTVIASITTAETVKTANYILFLTKKAIKAATAGRTKVTENILTKIQSLVSTEEYIRISEKVTAALPTPTEKTPVLSA